MSEPVRILHVFGRLDRGGAETFIMNVYRKIDRTKVQFDFMVHTVDKCAYDDEVKTLGGNIYRVPTYRVTNHFKYKSEWQKFFKSCIKYKMIHAHMTSTASIYLKIAKKYGMKSISHIHSTSSLGKGFAALIKDILQMPLKHISDYLFACSREAGIYCYGESSCNKSNFYVLANAIDSEKFIYNTTIRTQKRKDLNIDDKFVIGHVGNFTVPKNHHYLIDIFKEVYKKNSNTILLLVGNGELRGEIEQKVKKLELKDSVIFMGVRPDISDLLCAMDMFLFPSLFEGLPVTLIEAQASGLSCIISDVITQEVKITDLVEYVSLDVSPSYWADKILAYADGYERKNMQKKVKKAGFDIQEVVGWLEEFYLK